MPNKKLTVEECIAYIEKNAKTEFSGRHRIEGKFKYLFANLQSYTLKELRWAKKFTWMGA